MLLNMVVTSITDDQLCMKFGQSADQSYWKSLKVFLLHRRDSRNPCKLPLQCALSLLHCEKIQLQLYVFHSFDSSQTDQLLGSKDVQLLNNFLKPLQPFLNYSMAINVAISTTLREANIIFRHSNQILLRDLAALRGFALTTAKQQLFACESLGCRMSWCWFNQGQCLHQESLPPEQNLQL